MPTGIKNIPHCKADYPKLSCIQSGTKKVLPNMPILKIKIIILAIEKFLFLKMDRFSNGFFTVSSK